MRERDEAEREVAWKRTLRLIAPGTALREGVENVLRSKTGGLIVVGHDSRVASLMDGGFAIRSPFSPAALYELAKMDGAIVLSEDARDILYANVQLNPDPSIPTQETGTRHRTAERVARQTRRLVICVSQRRHVITLYQADLRYLLRDIGAIVARTNQALQTLERYKTALDSALANLSALEMDESVALSEVTSLLQRFEMVRRIRAELQVHIAELGAEGRLAAMQLEELTGRIDEELYLLVRDYACPDSGPSPQEILNELQGLTAEELPKGQLVAQLLGYSPGIDLAEQAVSPRGYRILHKIPRLPQPVIDNLADEFPTLGQIVSASLQELDEVEGIGAVRARTIKEGLRRVQVQAAMERSL